MKIAIKVDTSSVLTAIAMLSTLALSGCFTAFAPATDPCTLDPQNNPTLRACTQDEVRGMNNWQERTKLKN